MDEQKFRDWLKAFQDVLKIFVDAKNDNWKTFVRELNSFDKSLLEKCLSHRKSKPWSNLKVNWVRVDVLTKLVDWPVTYDEVNEIFEKSKKDFNYENWKLFWVLYPIYYFKHKDFIQKFLDDLEKSIVSDLWYEWLRVWWNDFNGWQNQWTDKAFVWLFNGSHPTWETAKQFRIQSKWSDKLIIWLFENKNFISGKYIEFDIANVTYKDILDQFDKYKDDILSDIFTWDKIPGILDYIKNNISKYWYIKEKAESQRKKFLDKYPLDWLKNLQISEYCYQRKWTWDGNNFTNLLVPNWTCSVVVWELIEKSENFLFYKDAEWNFAAANVMNDYKERAWDNIYDMFNLFISDTYNFVNNFNAEDYNCNDYILWATYLKSAILFFYKWDILINLWQNYIAQSIANKLWFNNQTDAIWYDILISKYLKDNIPEIVDRFWFYSIWRCLNDYYKTYLKSSKNVSVEYYAVWAFLWDVDEKQEFYNHEKLILGWHELWNIKDYNDDELVKKFEDLWYNDTLTHFKQTFKDFKKIKKWDIVCLKSVNRKSKEMYIYAVWVVQWWYDDSYEFLPWLWHSLPVKRKILDEKYTLDWAKYQKTLSKINDDEFKKVLDRLLNKWSDLSSNQNQMIDLNTILYWVPWTWKTYNTINYAVAIIENKSVEEIQRESQTDRWAVKKRYEEYLKKWFIVFTTFHQSYWYEDFIEWIKASVEWESVKYSVEPWCFKALCDRARTWEWFEVIYNKFLSDISENEEPYKLKTVTWKTFWVMVNSKSNLSLFTGKDLKPNWVITKDNLQRYLNWDDGFVIGWESYYNWILQYFKDKYKLGSESNNENNKYVFIIDEINRWNISKIFWELITLIEPDKRLWGNEELKVTLPYSNQNDFWIPSNIYILWTMNTADRSIALIDLALRRRFKFIEIEPKMDLLDGIFVAWKIDVRSMFEKINERIEFLYDRDHLLWHAYFMSLKKDNSLENLNSIMLNDVIPQLQEYFHEDWEKIQLVLWEWLINKKEINSIDVIGSSEYDSQFRYAINKTPSVENYINIYQKLNDQSE